MWALCLQPSAPSHRTWKCSGSGPTRSPWSHIRQRTTSNSQPNQLCRLLRGAQKELHPQTLIHCVTRTVYFQNPPGCHFPLLNAHSPWPLQLFLGLTTPSKCDIVREPCIFSNSAEVFLTKITYTCVKCGLGVCMFKHILTTIVNVGINKSSLHRCLLSCLIVPY